MNIWDYVLECITENKILDMYTGKLISYQFLAYFNLEKDAIITSQKGREIQSSGKRNLMKSNSQSKLRRKSHFP